VDFNFLRAGYREDRDRLFLEVLTASRRAVGTSCNEGNSS